MDELISPYNNEDRFEGYNTKQEFYNDAGYVIYYTNLIEIEARNEGVKFSRAVLYALKNEYINERDFERKFAKNERLEEKNDYGFKTSNLVINFYKEHNSASLQNSLKKFEKVSEIYGVDEQQILEIAKKIEKEEKFLSDVDMVEYYCILLYLVKDKAFEQKLTLLENSIFSNLELFTEVICASLRDDLNFKQNKDKISKIVKNYLIWNINECQANEINDNDIFYNSSLIEFLTDKDTDELLKYIKSKELRSGAKNSSGTQNKSQPSNE